MGIQAMLRKMGEAIDRRYLKKVGATSLSGSPTELLLLCYHPYEGKSVVQLPNSTMIQPGDVVGEFHLANKRITEMAETTEKGFQWRLLELLKEEFSRLAEACQNGIIPQNVQGFYGVNVLPAGAKRLGFTLIPIPRGWDRFCLGLWESILRVVFYSFKSKNKPSLKKTMDPYEIWITRADIIRIYGTARKNVDFE